MTTREARLEEGGGPPRERRGWNRSRHRGAIPRRDVEARSGRRLDMVRGVGVQRRGGGAAPAAPVAHNLCRRAVRHDRRRVQGAMQSAAAVRHARRDWRAASEPKARSLTIGKDVRTGRFPSHAPRRALPAQNLPCDTPQGTIGRQRPAAPPSLCRPFTGAFPPAGTGAPEGAIAGHGVRMNGGRQASFLRSSRTVQSYILSSFSDVARCAAILSVTTTSA